MDYFVSMLSGRKKSVAVKRLKRSVDGKRSCASRKKRLRSAEKKTG